MNSTTSRSTGHTLFITCFAALVATAFCFVLRAFVIDDWGHEFNLSATQKGELLGVGLWPFSISIVLLSLLIDRVGFRAVLWFAVACHLAGTFVLLTAAGYWALYIGTFVLALGNGAVEAAVNPLIATAYRTDKTKWLNMLHAGWPGGLVLGGLLALAQGGAVDWRWKIGLVIVPVIVYSLLLLRERFPVSERVAAGVSYRDMLAEAGYLSALIVAVLIVIEIGRVFAWPTALEVALIAAMTGAYAFYTRSPGRPLFIIMLLVMVPLATTELGTDSWITSLLEPEMAAIGLQPGWVLVYTSALMLILRLFAGPLVHRFSPLGLLALCSVDCSGRSVQFVRRNWRSLAAGGHALWRRQELLLADLDRLRRRAISKRRRGDHERAGGRGHAGCRHRRVRVAWRHSGSHHRRVARRARRAARYATSCDVLHQRENRRVRPLSRARRIKACGERP